MLDADTKRRIDTARDILVGKVPDPKSQVEQITIALIYKFMDDIDAQSEELGGQREFFAGQFARYGWARLMRPGLGGHEMLNLYADAIRRMPENPGIPPLFRDIFNNAFLPYRNPETLRAFLKVIDEFNYDHSERLGDAFEYLLSVLGSQGDAGQFRTPRHIIDFIVSIIDPKKDEVILDPACGTAGFLISSYKHILSANTDADGNSALTPDDSKRLAGNFQGYDISPDMVRLSLVNMYLHGFVDPHIFEYDTLTSEDRWNDFADVILANPPFMSPKGGIRPHNRFSVQSRRSEVLFVDYMAEHLNPAGRAGIIVPEGIIFQSQKAHRQLRKMLVEDYLVAVVSLPGGVFKPYSGVKTSILILDRALSRKTDSIAFFKVENDGFDLGDQRRPISDNDLPQVQAELTEYLRRLRSGERLDDDQPELGLVVEESKVAEDAEYNLSGERYRESQLHGHLNWPVVKLGDVCHVINGSTPSRKNVEYWEDGTIPWFTIDDVRRNGRRVRETIQYTTSKALEETSLRLLPRGTVLLCCTASVGEYAFTEIEVTTNQQFNGLVVKNEFSHRLLPEYLFQISGYFKSELLRLSGKTSFNFVSGRILKTVQIPLPPLEVQKEIVAEIEGYQKIIGGARAVVDNYRPQIAVDPEWPMATIGTVCTINPRKSELAHVSSNTIVSFVPMADLNENSISFAAKQQKTLGNVGGSYTYFADDDVLLAKVTPCFENGKAGIAKNLENGIGFGSSEFYVLRSSMSVLPEWIYFCVTYPLFRQDGIRNMTGTGGLQRVPRIFIGNYPIPVPSLNVQQKIVTEIETEQSLVNANRELITRFEQKIQDTIGRVWAQ